MTTTTPRISDSTLTLWGRILAGGSVLVGVGAAGLTIAMGGPGFFVESMAVHSAVAAIGFSALAWFTISAQPRNRDVWVFAVGGLFGTLAMIGFAAIAIWGSAAVPEFSFDLAVEMGLSPSDMPVGTALMAGASTWAFGIAMFSVLTFGLLWFPDGRLPSPRWAWLAWFSLGAVVLESLLSFLWTGTPTSTVPLLGLESDTSGVLAVVALAAISLPLTASGLCVASLVARYRSSPPLVRRQILWIGWGGALLVVVVAALLVPVIVGFFLSGSSSIPVAFVALSVSAAEVVFIGSIGVAITKYRLYDIDVVISRTVTYGVLAVFITGVYVVVVVVVRSFVGGSSLVLAVGATALVAALFEPVRSRVQRWANRLVFGERATPYAVLSELTARYSVAESDEVALSQVAKLVASGTGATRSVVWLRVGDRLRPEAVSGGAKPGWVHIDGDDLPDLGADAEPIRHGGELLGALSVTKERGDPVTPGDRQLLADVAAGAGLLLRNIRLNAELADRAEELRVSRRRLVAAQDAERRRLERNLHDGAQQQVVALKVKLGLAKTLAEREDVADVAGAVGDLAADTQRAVDGMRVVARGIYPPLLEAEGLRAALLAVARDAPYPAEVEIGDIVRYPPEVEATVYFSVLEAINRSMPAAGETARVRVDEDAGSLTFTVEGLVVSTAGGVGSSTAADRVDALGGTLGYDPDTHTITGRFPTTALLPA